MKKGCMRVTAAVGAVLWAGAVLASDVGVLRLLSYNVLAKSLLLSLLIGRFGDSELKRIFYKCSHPPRLRISK